MKNYKTLDSICSITSSKRIFANEYQKNGIPFYRGKEIIELANGAKPSTEIFIDHSKFLEISRKFGIPQNDDILITAVGTLGVSYLVKNETFYFKDGNLIWIKNISSTILPKYLYYYFKSNTFINCINTLAIGSTQQAITIDRLKTIRIPVEDIFIQQHIVDTIGSIDDLIENKQRENEYLTKLGKRLYSIQNDSDTVLATKKISFIKGIETGSKEYQEIKTDENVEYFRVGDMNSLESKTYVSKKYLQYANAQLGDVFISLDGDPGRVGFTIDGCYSGSLKKLVSSSIKNGYLYFWALSDQTKQCINEHAFGTTILHAGKSLEYLQINKNIDSELMNQIDSVYSLMVDNVKVIKKLTALKHLFLNKFFG